MATYYRWRRSTVEELYSTETASTFSLSAAVTATGLWTFYTADSYTVPTGDLAGYAILNDPSELQINRYDGAQYISGNKFVSFSRNYVTYLYTSNNQMTAYSNTISGQSTLMLAGAVGNNIERRYNFRFGPGTSQGYVYSTSSTAYPNGGVSGGYYYDQRTTVSSPTAPSGITYPASITSTSVSISWTAATSNVPDYSVSQYEVSYSTNGGSSWTVAGTTASTSYSFDIPTGTTSITFRVRARDSNNQWGNYVTGTASQVLLAPTLTVPQMVMQGQSATVSWTAVEGADSYTLQRKSSADADWTQVYSGAATTFSETVGSWTSVQYRVQAVFGETAGGWATSDPIQIVSASALVISGSDGDLGTLVSDVSYTVSSDGSTELTVVETINGTETRTYTATNGATNKIPVVDLPTGYGTIKITASTNPGSGVVTVTREWTYTKAAITFPDAGSVADLTQQGKTIWAKTIAEAVRTPGIWGGNLGLALQKLMGAVLYNSNKVAKYTEVKVSLSGKSEGDIISLPENGQIVEFYVAKLDYESGLNGTGRVLVVRKNLYIARPWDAGGVNAYSASDIDIWMESTYKPMLHNSVQSEIGTTKIYYTPGNGNDAVTTIERGVFPLSATEMGGEETNFNVEGTVLPISETLQQASNGPKIIWTRTPTIGRTDTAISLSRNPNPSFDNTYCTATQKWYYRPAFTLPSSFESTYYVGSDGSVHDSQEYEEAGTFTDISGGAIPMVSIETGSYVGTGTSGESNPNTLTFSGKPMLVFITGRKFNDNNMIASIFPAHAMTEEYAGSIYGTWFASSNFYSNPTTMQARVVGNKMQWYCTNDFNQQLNESGVTYSYIAFIIPGGAT